MSLIRVNVKTSIIFCVLYIHMYPSFFVRWWIIAHREDNIQITSVLYWQKANNNVSELEERGVENPNQINTASPSLHARGHIITFCYTSHPVYLLMFHLPFPLWLKDLTSMVLFNKKFDIRYVNCVWLDVWLLMDFNKLSKNNPFYNKPLQI